MFKLQVLKENILKMSDSDRRALMLLLLFFLSIALYEVTVWSFKYRKEGIENFNKNRALTELIYGQADKLMLMGAVRKAEGSDQSLLALTSSTAKQSQIEFKRFQPEGDKILRLWLEGVNFNSLLSWLHVIDKQYGISVLQISVEQAKSEGLVDVRLTLER